MIQAGRQQINQAQLPVSLMEKGEEAFPASGQHEELANEGLFLLEEELPEALEQKAELGDNSECRQRLSPQDKCYLNNTQMLLEITLATAKLRSIPAKCIPASKAMPVTLGAQNRAVCEDLWNIKLGHAGLLTLLIVGSGGREGRDGRTEKAPQRSCGCPTPGNVRGQAGQGLQQPGLEEGGLDWMIFKAPPIQTILCCLQENGNFEVDSQTPVLSHNCWATIEHDKIFNFLQQSENFQETLGENTLSLQDDTTAAFTTSPRIPQVSPFEVVT
ncbi:hypothetical protein TURU_111049 [Turdus rufiventris]|nr:hypothetical protein TURU_111049 [Turdus rufiventris]